VDVHNGGGEGVRPMWTHVDRGRGQKRDFLVDVINGWPLTDCAGNEELHRWSRTKPYCKCL